MDRDPAHASTANKNSRAGTVVASTSVSAAHAAESSSSALHETDPRARLLCRGAFGGMLAPRPANEEWAAPQPGAGARRVAPAPLRQVWPAAPCPCGRNLLHIIPISTLTSIVIIIITIITIIVCIVTIIIIIIMMFIISDR